MSSFMGLERTAEMLDTDVSGVVSPVASETDDTTLNTCRFHKNQRQ